MTWVNDNFTAGTLGGQWTAYTPSGSVVYPAAGGSSVQLVSGSSGNTIWVSGADATRLGQGIANDSTFDIYALLLDDAPAEAGIYVRGATITSDFVKFGLYAGGFTFAWGVGGSTGFANGGTDGTYPMALRLSRSGSTWTAYYAANITADTPSGITWTQYDTGRTAAITVVEGGLYAGGADSPRFGFGFSSLAAAGGPVAIAGYAGNVDGAGGGLGASRAVLGVGAEVGGAAGLLGAARSLAGFAGNVDGAAGALAASRAVSGYGATVDGAGGALAATRPLGGYGGNVDGAAGLLGTSRAIEGVAGNAGSATGSFAGGSTPVGGFAGNVSGAGGDVGRARPLVGFAGNVGSAAGDVLRGKTLDGVAAGAGSAVGGLVRGRGLDGSGAAVGGAAGLLAAVRALAGYAAAVSSGRGDLDGAAVPFAKPPRAGLVLDPVRKRTGMIVGPVRGRAGTITDLRERLHAGTIG